MVWGGWCGFGSLFGGLRCGLFLWSLLWCGVFVLLWESFVECFVGLVCSVVWCGVSFMSLGA